MGHYAMYEEVREECERLREENARLRDDYARLRDDIDARIALTHDHLDKLSLRERERDEAKAKLARVIEEAEAQLKAWQKHHDAAKGE